MAIDDAVGSKARALNDRRASRDYFDLNGVLGLDDWTPERIYQALLRVRSIGRAEFASDLRAGHERHPKDYKRFGMTLDAMEAMFARLDAAADDIEHAGPTTSHASPGAQVQPRRAAGSSSGGQFDVKRQSPPEITL